MPGIVRVGDTVTGTCVSDDFDPKDFTGVWQTGSSVCTVDGRGIVRLNDTGLGDNGCTFKLVAGSSVATADGLQIGRVGDPIEVIDDGGTGVCVTGSGDSNSA